jgi:hypothetical protein
MPDNASTMVLRSINLPFLMEEQLRRLAFLMRKPKADVVRWCIGYGLSALSKELAGMRSSDIPSFPLTVSQEEQGARERDISQMMRAAQR